MGAERNSIVNSRPQFAQPNPSTLLPNGNSASIAAQPEINQYPTNTFFNQRPQTGVQVQEGENNIVPTGGLFDQANTNDPTYGKPKSIPTEIPIVDQSLVDIQEHGFKGAFKGLYQDTVKIFTTAFVSSASAEIVKNSMLAGDTPLNNIVYNSFVDSGFARLLTPFQLSQSFKLLKKIPIIKHMPEDVMQLPLGSLFTYINRGMTAAHNTRNQQMAKGKKSSTKQNIIEESSKAGIHKLQAALSSTLFKDYIEKPFGKLLSLMFGINAGEHATTTNGNVVKDENNKDVSKLAKVNYFHLLSSMGTMVFLTSKLPNHVRSVGFGNAKNPLEATRALFMSNFSRVLSTIYGQNPAKVRTAGMNLDESVKDTARRKILIPACQNIASAIAPFIPGDANTMIKTLGISSFLELTVPFYEVGINNPKEHRIPDETNYLGHKYIKPGIKWLEKDLIPVIKSFNNGLNKVGIKLYDNKIEGMYSDAKANKKDDKADEMPKYLNRFKDNTAFDDFKLLLKTFAQKPRNIFKLFNKAHSDNAKYNEKIQTLTDRQEIIEKFENDFKLDLSEMRTRTAFSKYKTAADVKQAILEKHPKLKTANDLNEPAKSELGNTDKEDNLSQNKNSEDTKNIERLNSTLKLSSDIQEEELVKKESIVAQPS